jgi:hypothetical protein
MVYLYKMTTYIYKSGPQQKDLGNQGRDKLSCKNTRRKMEEGRLFFGT